MSKRALPPAPSCVPPAELVEAPSPPRICYIQLGPGGRWAKRSLSAGEIHFGHPLVSHELGLGGDPDAIAAYLVGLGCGSGKARDFAREIADFYHLGPDTIWITIEAGQVWWARAHPEVFSIPETTRTGARYRRTIGPWQKADAQDSTLSGALNRHVGKVAQSGLSLFELDLPNHLFRDLLTPPEPNSAEEVLRKNLIAPPRPAPRDPTDRFVNGAHPLPFDVLSFWRWVGSDLKQNALRGWLVEYLIAQVLGIDEQVRDYWRTVDLLMEGGLRISVKSAAPVQTWSAANLSRCVFRGLRGYIWSPGTHGPSVRIDLGRCQRRLNSDPPSA